VPTLHFKGKTVIETYHHTVPHHRLEFDPKLSVLPKGQKPGLDGNLIIEGDNLLALKALLPTHAGKVKCVYIDPPYNTGETSWTYNDRLSHPIFKEWIGREVGKEGEDTTRHDKWCCMMWPRLQLLRELLQPEGVLMISIDETEYGNLRQICDEVFRTTKPLATFVWKRRSPTGMRSDPVSVDHEYVLVYARDPSQVELSGLIATEADYPLMDEHGRYASSDLTVGATEEDRPHQAYTLVNPRSKKRYPHNPNRVWRFEPKTMKEVIAEGLVIWPEDNPESRMTRPRFKTYFDPKNPKPKPVSSWIETQSSQVPAAEDLEFDEEINVMTCGLNAEGGRALRRVFGKKVFDYPKPPSLVRSLVRIATAGDDVILDSFAGSGTTAQAVLEANAIDKQSRRFILVQMPTESVQTHDADRNICNDVTRQRVASIINGYSYKRGKRSIREPGLGGGFVYTRVGNPLFTEYRDLGKKLPPFEDLAKYVFYTETSREIDLKKVNAKTGLIGRTEAAGGTAYYLLYTPNHKEDHELSLDSLGAIAKLEKGKSRTWVVYCEKIWMHPEELRRAEKEHGVRIRPMLVPFNLK
jgi:adenine-specific DNA-methyltransferase